MLIYPPVVVVHDVTEIDTHIMTSRGSDPLRYVTRVYSICDESSVICPSTLSLWAVSELEMAFIDTACRNTITELSK